LLRRCSVFSNSCCVYSICTYIHTHAHTHTSRHAATHTHAHTHTHTHTHTNYRGETQRERERERDRVGEREGGRERDREKKPNLKLLGFELQFRNFEFQHVYLLIQRCCLYLCFLDFFFVLISENAQAICLFQQVKLLVQRSFVLDFFLF
jgi:hypothetical protein